MFYWLVSGHVDGCHWHALGSNRTRQ